MSLIELLFHYRDLVTAAGRSEADEELYAICHSLGLRREIKLSVNDDGEFINYCGENFDIRNRLKDDSWRE